MSNSVWPHRWQPTRLPCPWDSPCKNTGVGCHFLLQCMKVKMKLLSLVQPSAIPWTAAFQVSPSMGFSRQEYWSGVPLPSPRKWDKCCSKELFSSVQSRPTLSNESTLCMRWPKYWSFSFSIIPSKEHPGLISFRMDWLDLFAVQGILRSLLQHHSSKASILQHSAFFTVQLSHSYMITGKTIALTRWTFVGKGMSLIWICHLGWS